VVGAIFSLMAYVRCSLGAGHAAMATVLAGALAAAGPAASAGAAAARTPGRARAQLYPSLRHSTELWATIDVCNPPHERNTVGIRGSMPGDGQARDAMFMRFRLQYMDLALHRWVDMAQADSGFLAVGSSRTARQAGRSFVLYPPAGGGAFILRGIVSFQWRRGPALLATISRATKAGHRSLAGADPPNYSAATCRIA
jgi:hypothetical protein